MHTTKLALLLLLALPSIAIGQMDHVYIQTTETDPSPSGIAVNTGYPMPLMAGQEWKGYSQPIYEANNLDSYSSTGSVVTFTLASGATTAMIPGDAIRFFNVPGSAKDTLCQVNAVPDSTHFSITTFSCVNPESQPFNNAGTGSMTGAFYWKQEGPGMNPRVKVEIIDTGTIPGKYFLRSGDRSQISSTDPTCNPDKHTPSCYEQHPILEHQWPTGTYIEVDPEPGDCSKPGSIQGHNNALTSTKSFDVKYTTDQSPQKSAVRHYLVCNFGAGTGSIAQAKFVPGYKQLYRNSQDLIVGSVWGHYDQYVQYTLIQAVPGVGDASIDTTNAPTDDAWNLHHSQLPEAVFKSGTVAADYIIKVCPDVALTDTNACDTLPRHVVAADPPLANPEKVEQTPCDIDPRMVAAGGHVYEIGPGQAYSDIMSTPMQNYPWGSIWRIHNENSTLGNPVTIHNYAEWHVPTNFAAFDTVNDIPAMVICGIPNPTTGEMPVIDAENATAANNINPYTGINQVLTINGDIPNLPNFDVYNGKRHAMKNVLVSNLKIIHNMPGYQFYPPGTKPGTGAPEQWGTQGQIVKFYAQDHMTVSGIRALSDDSPFLSDCVGVGGWVRNCNEDVAYEGVHVEGTGIVGDPHMHPIYAEDNRPWVIGGLWDGTTGDQDTTCFALRPSRGGWMYNRCVTQPGYHSPNGWGVVTELQDAYNYYLLAYSFGPGAGWDQASCSNGNFDYPFCDTNGQPGVMAVPGGVNTYAAFQAQHFYSMFFVGNAFQGAPNEGCSLSTVSTDSSNSLDNEHTVIVTYNTTDCPASRSGQTLGGNLFMWEPWRPQIVKNDFAVEPIDPPTIWAYNNNWWWNSNNPPAQNYYYWLTQANKPAFPINWDHNLIHTGMFNYATNIPQVYGGNGFQAGPSGMYEGSSSSQFVGMNPVEARLGVNWSSSRFIQTATAPYDFTTLVPGSGSAAIGAAMTSLPYPANLYPPLFNANDGNGHPLRRRTDMTTIGPYDPIR